MQRRTFIKTTALTSAGLAVAGLGYGLGKNSSSVVNVGVVGTGDRGSGMISVMNGIPGLNVIGCCDIIPFRLEKAVARVASGKAKGYKEYKKMLENKDIDAILICTPFSEHAQMAIDALDAGKHVYCEKTLTKGEEGIKALVEKVRTTDRIFQTGHQYHSSEMYRFAVQHIRYGGVGKIAAIECQWNRHGNWRRHVPEPKWE